MNEMKGFVGKDVFVRCLGFETLSVVESLEFAQRRQIFGVFFSQVRSMEQVDQLRGFKSHRWLSLHIGVSENGGAYLKGQGT